MSDYLDRLEHELLAAGRRYRAASVASPPARRRRVWSSLPVLLSVAVTAVIVAVVVATGLVSGTATKPTHGRHLPSRVIQPKIYTAPACRLHGRRGLPPVAATNASPAPELGSILSLARQPAAGNGLAALGRYDRYPVGVLTVFARFIHVVSGARGTRLAFFPAIVCNQTDFGRSSGSPFPKRVRIAPAQAIVMLVLSNPGTPTAILAGTAPTILNGPALPGLDLSNRHGFGVAWIQATVVPDGVARVVMDFTPPFLHHYTAMATIHDNIGIVVRRPDYTPTTVTWYAADGHVIRTFVDRSDLRIDQCLAAHRKACKS